MWAHFIIRHDILLANAWHIRGYVMYEPSFSKLFIWKIRRRAFLAVCEHSGSSCIDTTHEMWNNYKVHGPHTHKHTCCERLWQSCDKLVTHDVEFSLLLSDENRNFLFDHTMLYSVFMDTRLILRKIWHYHSNSFCVEMVFIFFQSIRDRLNF